MVVRRVSIHNSFTVLTLREGGIYIIRIGQSWKRIRGFHLEPRPIRKYPLPNQVWCIPKSITTTTKACVRWLTVFSFIFVHFLHTDKQTHLWTNQSGIYAKCGRADEASSWGKLFLKRKLRLFGWDGAEVFFPCCFIKWPHRGSLEMICCLPSWGT